MIGLWGLILWGGSLFNPPSMPSPLGFVPFYTFLFNGLSEYPHIAVIAGWVILIASAFILNQLISGSDLVQKNSSLAGFIFVLLMSFYPPLLTLNPMLICCLFLLMILRQLLNSYHREEPFDLVFSAGFFAAIGSFFYFPFIFFYGMILFSFLFFREAGWREWISSLLGFLTPFVFLSLYYFWNDNLVEKYLVYFSYFKFRPEFSLLFEPAFTLLGIFIVTGFLVSVFSTFNRSNERTIEIRRKSYLINWILAFALISIPFSSHLIIFHFEFFFVPFSAIITTYLLQLRKIRWQEPLLMIFIILIILNNLVFMFK
ncbi:MAG: DUF6427 family protein [Bacteroidota bacterium]